MQNLKTWQKVLIAILAVVLIGFVIYCLVAIADGLTLAELWEKIFPAVTEGGEVVEDAVETVAKIM